MGQARIICCTAWVFEKGFDRPIFAVFERFDFHLAFANDPQGDGLHTASGAGPWQFAPQHGGQIKAHEIIKRAAGQICLDQWRVDLARVFHRFGHGRFGDCVENDAANWGVFFDRFFREQCLG